VVTPRADEPGPDPTPPRVGNFLLASSDPVLLAGVAAELGAEADVRVNRVGGTTAQPTILAAKMPLERADRLREEFPDRLVIEVDQPLEHFDIDIDGRQPQPAVRSAEAMPENEDPHPPVPPNAGERGQTLRKKPEQYLIAAVPSDVVPAGFEPLDTESLVARLQKDPEIQLRQRIPLPGSAASATPAGAGVPAARQNRAAFTEIIVAEMPAHRAAALERDPTTHIEPNHPIRLTAPAPLATPTDAPWVNPGVGLSAGPRTAVTFLVSGSDSGPLPGATVTVLSAEGNFQASTGPDGRAAVILTVHDLAAITGVYVKPAGGYWEHWTDDPNLSTTSDNIVVLRPLEETFPEFPGRQVAGWGLAALTLDQIPPTYRGQGIKVAVVDSGAVPGHPELADRIAHGADFVGGEDGQWSVDVVGHGTHCAGVIAAADNGTGILGIAVEAELHVCRIFPGGMYGDIAKAINYCVENQIDLINLSLGGGAPSQIISDAIEQARQAGVACVVAAGNTAGPVQFPGRLPGVLTVAAVGKLGQYPADTYHAKQVWGQPDAEGYFSPAFTCHGPEVDLCAPGVAILSSVPDRGYAAWDGTSMATPHVTGLAALVLAHHPDFRDGYKTRDARRVDRLFDILRSSCRPVDFGDPGRTGAGMPIAVRALALDDQSLATRELSSLREAMQSAGLLPASPPDQAADPLEQVRRILQAAGLIPRP
jgi:hypothetical protein